MTSSKALGKVNTQSRPCSKTGMNNNLGSSKVAFTSTCYHNNEECKGYKVLRQIKQVKVITPWLVLLRKALIFDFSKQINSKEAPE